MNAISKIEEQNMTNISEMSKIFEEKFSISVEEMQQFFLSEFMKITQDEIDNYINQKNANSDFTFVELQKMYKDYNKNIPFFSRKVLLEETEENLVCYIKNYNIDLKATFTVKEFKEYIDILRTKGLLYCLIYQGIYDRTVNLEELLKLDIVVENDCIRSEDINRLLEVIEYIYKKEQWLLEKANKYDTYTGKRFSMHWDVDEDNVFYDTTVYPTNMIYYPDNNLWVEKTCIPLSEQAREEAVGRSLNRILGDMDTDTEEKSFQKVLKPYYLPDRKLNRFLLPSND